VLAPAEEGNCELEGNHPTLPSIMSATIQLNAFLELGIGGTRATFDRSLPLSIPRELAHLSS
jgi:hypothetical protein